MNIYLRHVSPHGFKGTGMFIDAKWHSFYRRIDLVKREVIVVGNLTPQTVSVFGLTPRQFKKFTDGDLTLIPPGCCNPSASGKESLGDPEIIFSGVIRSQKHLAGLLRMAM